MRFVQRLFTKLETKHTKENLPLVSVCPLSPYPDPIYDRDIFEIRRTEAVCF